MTVYPQIRVGKAEVYLSGTVICRPGQTIEVTPVPTAVMPYRIQIAFIENPFLPARVDVANQPNNIVLVTLTNFGNGIASTSTPVNIGYIEGAPLSIDIAMFSTGVGTSLLRAITFTVLRGAP